MVIYTRVALQAKINSASRRFFKNVVVVVIACIAADMCSYVVDKRTFSGANVLNHVSMFIAVFLTCCVGYTFNKMFDHLFHIQRTKKAQTAVDVLYLLPIIVVGVCLIMNVYIPVSGLESFIFDGTEYKDLSKNYNIRQLFVRKSYLQAYFQQIHRV